MSASKRRKKPLQESELEVLQRLLAAEVTIPGDDGRTQRVSYRWLILRALRKKAATGETAASTLLHRELKLYPQLKAALLGCCRFQGHLVKVESETGGGSWEQERDGSSAGSSSLRP